jgi:large subunit ribosomal protein L22
MKAYLQQTRISPKKANLVAGVVRGQKAEKALELLKYMPKKAARLLYKLLASAVANAEHNFSQKKEDLLISKILVTAGPTYKRGQSHSKGRVTPLLKRTSHITIELETISAS